MIAPHSRTVHRRGREPPGSKRRSVTHAAALLDVRPAPRRFPARSGSEKLKAERVEYLLAALPGWQAGPEQETLVRRVDFDSHAMAASFVQWVFSLSERRSQFPEIRMERGTVELTVGNPRVGGLTERDFAFARQIGLGSGGEVRKSAGSRGGQPTTSPSRKEVLQS
jgi:4a-hydroxytetrahydrobiopterin dehydratase